MTSTITTATDLLNSNDSQFLSLLAVWSEHREPPVGLIDYLLEMGLERQSKGVEWVIRQPERYAIGFNKPSKPFPYQRTTDRLSNWLLSWGNASTADLIRYLPSDGYASNMTQWATLNESLVYLLDNLSDSHLNGE